MILESHLIKTLITQNQYNTYVYLSKTNTPFVIIIDEWDCVTGETVTIKKLYIPPVESTVSCDTSVGSCIGLPPSPMYTSICSFFIHYSNQRSQNHFWHWHILPEFCRSRRLGMSRH